MRKSRERRRTATRRADPLGVGMPADTERRMRLVFTADEIAAMSGLRRAAIDVILASLASDQGLAFVQEHAAAIRAELTWVSTAPPRLFLRAFSPERLRAHEQRRRVLRMVSRLASTTTTIRTRCAEASAIRVRALAHRLPAS